MTPEGLKERMNPRFDVFRRQTGRLIRWIGTAANLEDAEKLIRADSGGASDDRYLVVHSASGVAETVMNSNATDLSQGASLADTPQPNVR